MSQASGSERDDDDADGVTKADILQWIKSYVWSGENDPEEVAMMIEDELGEEDEVDEDWLEKEIRREFAAKRKAEKTWPEVTDCDHLDQAFKALEKQGVIALHMAGVTQSDGYEEVEDAYNEAGGKESNYAGHCYYTEQDQQLALDGSGLCIGFGHLSGDNAKGVEVGQMVRTALEGEGLKVEWDGTIGKRLCIDAFRWQRRSPR
jgi:hypothetical protein